MSAYTSQGGFQCECCLESFPVELREIHHMVPRYLGGTDDSSNLTDICEHCHSTLHTAANKMLKGQDPTVFIEQVYKDNFQAIANCKKLANTIVSAEKNKNEAVRSDTKTHRDNQPIQVELDYVFYHRYVKAAAKACKVPLYQFVQNSIKNATIQVLGNEPRVYLETEVKDSTLEGLKRPIVGAKRRR